jgi:hypothetical protein
LRNIFEDPRRPGKGSVPENGAELREESTAISRVISKCTRLASMAL